MAEIQNPNQQGGGGLGGDSRSLLSFMVIFVLLVVAFQIWGPKKQDQKQQPTESSQQATHLNQPAAAVHETATPAPAARTAARSKKAANTAEPTVQAASAAETVVENELYRITFSNRGGEATSWVLKKYKAEDQKSLLNLVDDPAAAKFGYPLSLFTYDAGLRDKLNSAMYVPSATGTIAVPGELSYTYSAGGLTVRKTFHFDTSYLITADISVTDNGAPVTALLAWPSGLDGNQSHTQASSHFSYAAATFDDSVDGKTDNVAVKKVVGGNTLHGTIDYAGISDLYFAAEFLPDNPADMSVVTLNNSIDVPRNPDHPQPNEVDHLPVLGAAVGQFGSPTVHTRVFVGPKSLDLLQSIHTTNGSNLEHVVSFGWWGWVAKPMLYVLRFFVTHGIPNWGWAILVLTFILNLAMLPTRVMMMKSQVKMARIQPALDAIKAKYAKYKSTDPRRQEMNKEMFDLQRKEGINMFGSCLPMLLQYPLLFGFYRMLEYAIELRQAHWLWLTDLSGVDPLHILPIFVIVSMFLSQLMMPSPGMDQSQQRMMAFMMPVVFGVMMWNIGSGVALYWAGSNIMGVGTQVVMNRTSMGQELRAIQAKRAAKKKK
ncbi:MAG TPA: membrane protein insertase YidC [Acidobacteriaceae bacterium]